ncbi:MAG TPA: FG-GAP-like repeat-containing protein, partial [Vicinamibacterales bacterium]|nr:FG-GAP-like repeat-containing protein [Vicinamibacterales bacterium]
FAFLTDHFEDIEIIGRGEPGPSARHGANALSFADFDNDGDLDLFWGDFFEPGVLLIQNIGATCSTPSFHVDPVPLPFSDTRTSGYNAPVPVDFDGDGDLDFLMGVIGGSFNPVATAADNFYYFERTAKDAFELRTRRFLNGIDLGSETVPATGDLNGDGVADLLVGSKIDTSGDAGRLTIFWGEAQPGYRQAQSLKLVDAFHLAPALGDLDGDGDLDLLVGTWNQDVRYFQNQGTPREPRFVEDAARAIVPPRSSLTSPVLGDIDGDGDLDLFVGTATGAVYFYRNDGTPKVAKFLLVSEKVNDPVKGRRSRPALADLTGDGLLDLAVGHEEGGVAFYRNAGTRTAPRFLADPSLTLNLPPISTPVALDVDRDGRIDILSGGVSGGLVFWKNVR